MALDRDEVPIIYSVMPVLPHGNMIERIKWVTNIFISSTLEETRTALTDVPAFNIQYRFSLKCLERDFLLGLKDAENRWMLPMLPHLSKVSNIGGQLVSQAVGDVRYPYHEYLLLWRGNDLSYRRIAGVSETGGLQFVEDTHSTDVFNSIIASDEFFVAPCYEAYLLPDLSYKDFGEPLDAHEVTLSFRYTARSAVAMTYTVDDDFPFLESLQRPIDTVERRNQEIFFNEPASPHSWTPLRSRPDEASRQTCEYFLETHEYLREDYALRGHLMRIKGSAGTAEFLSEDGTYRIDDDTLTINYHWGVSTATIVVREVLG